MSTLTASEIADVTGTGVATIYYLVGLLVQTVFFGMYTILIWLSTRMLLERKLRSTVNQVMFGLTSLMYLLSAAYWVYSVADGIDRMHQLIAQATQPGLVLPAHTALTIWSPLFNSIIAINYVISDCVVVWRARIICLRHHRKYMWISIFFLICSARNVGIYIVFRIVGTAISPIANLDTTTGLGRGITIIQVVILFTSTLSNLSATGVVSATAYQHLRVEYAVFAQSRTSESSSRTNKILLLIVETGAAYSLVALIGLISTLVKLPEGTLGDIYAPVNVQIAGAYPSIVLLLVSRKNSLTDSSVVENTNSALNSGSRPVIFSTVAPSPGFDTSRNAVKIDFAHNRGSSVSSREPSGELKGEIEERLPLTPRRARGMHAYQGSDSTLL
ncbi:hypothetical protein HMN09_00755800 [Mycena chlorophos]|uniref:Uncharacterized protein n=1 Tax=Mycena chlorophos TaxID=658473 RepID=A0A8H6SX84_MYCCL|nr:hypothetical protein HMN09_00755800 [Mycena chlorophos]